MALWLLLLVIKWIIFIPLYKVGAAEVPCNDYLELIFGEKYSIVNPGYPNNYSSNTNCTWELKTAADSKIYLSCTTLNLPVSANCNADRLSVSVTGDITFGNINNYCGNGSFSVISHGTVLTIGLFSPSKSTGGQFFCSVTSIKDESSPLSRSTAEPLASCDCGWKPLTRIVGGVESGINEYPFMAALIFQGKLWCGANIISDRYVLTAGHCVLRRNPADFFVLVGDHNLSTGTDTNASALYRVSAYEMYPQYIEATQENDMAILQTATTIIFSPRVGPICLPFRYTNYGFAGQVVILLGWGQLEFTGALSNVLQKVKVTVLSNQQCSTMQGESITDGEMCTYSNEAKDACQSDSGGPVVWTDTSTNRYQLIGLISHGVGCGSALPGINTRVTRYLQWIVQRTGASYCIK